MITLILVHWLNIYLRLALFLSQGTFSLVCCWWSDIVHTFVFFFACFISEQNKKWYMKIKVWNETFFSGRKPALIIVSINNIKINKNKLYNLSEMCDINLYFMFLFLIGMSTFNSWKFNKHSLPWFHSISVVSPVYQSSHLFE